MSSNARFLPDGIYIFHHISILYIIVFSCLSMIGDYSQNGPLHVRRFCKIQDPETPPLDVSKPKASMVDNANYSDENRLKIGGRITPQKNERLSPEKGPCQKERLVFQASFFGGHVSFQGCRIVMHSYSLCF